MGIGELKLYGEGTLTIACKSDEYYGIDSDNYNGNVDAIAAEGSSSMPTLSNPTVFLPLDFLNSSISMFLPVRASRPMASFGLDTFYFLPHNRQNASLRAYSAFHLSFMDTNASVRKSSFINSGSLP